MRSHVMHLIGALLVSCSVSGAAEGTEARDVRATLAQWVLAIEQGDIERFVTFYSDEFALPEAGMAARRPGAAQPGALTPTGREAARSLGQNLLGRGVIYTIKDRQIVVAGERAVADSLYEATQRGASRWEFTLGKEAGGWRILAARNLGRALYEQALPGFGEDYPEILERWSAANLTWIQETLFANPPNTGDTSARARSLREHALTTLDEPLHIRSAPMLRSVRQFLRNGIDRALSEMRIERVTDGATIWKLYNHGVVIRTPNHTWAFDLYEGYGDAVMSDEQIDAILGEIEALFCSHWHRDHTSLPVVRKAIQKGIPVYVSPLPQGREEFTLQRVSEGIDSALIERLFTVVPLGGRGVVKTASGELSYHAYPGHQDGYVNSVFVVTAEDMTFLHMGDQYNLDDFDIWVDHVAEEHRVDVMFDKPIALARTLQGIKPRVWINGHENELGHNFEHRHSYMEAYERLGQSDVEWHVLAWGERVHVNMRRGDR